MKTNDKTTHLEIMDHLRKEINNGTICPCCQQTVKMYRFKLTGKLASTLIKFYHANDWVHPINKFKTVNGDYAKLRHWKFIESDPEENDNPKTKSSGMWRITETGKKFVEKKLYQFEKVKLFNNKAWGFEGHRIDIVQALGNKFDYWELMNDKGK